MEVMLGRCVRELFIQVYNFVWSLIISVVRPASLTTSNVLIIVSSNLKVVKFNIKRKISSSTFQDYYYSLATKLILHCSCVRMSSGFSLHSNYSDIFLHTNHCCINVMCVGSEHVLHTWMKNTFCLGQNEPRKETAKEEC